MQESIQTEIDKNEIRKLQTLTIEENIRRQSEVVVNVAMKMREAEYSIGDFQRVCCQFKEVVDACKEILAMLKSHLLLDLPEDTRARLEATEKLHQEVLKSFAEFSAGLEVIISEYKHVQSPSGEFTSQQREELQEKQRELVEKLSEEQKVVAELRSKLDAQSAERRAQNAERKRKHVRRLFERASEHCFLALWARLLLSKVFNKIKR